MPVELVLDLIGERASRKINNEAKYIVYWIPAGVYPRGSGGGNDKKV